MTGYEPVTGEYRLYVKQVSQETCQAFFWKMLPAFTCAAILARENDIYVTEKVKVTLDGPVDMHNGAQVVTKREHAIFRVYYWAKGQTMPELYEPASAASPARSNGSSRAAVEV